MTYGAIHWYVPILFVIYYYRVFVQPKSPILILKLASKKIFKLFRSRWRIGGEQRCKYKTP